MSLSDEAFRYLPELRDTVLDPQESRFRCVDFDALDQRMRDLGYPDDWRRTEEEREATRLSALGDRMDRDLWVFAYGSLMWDPAVYYCELRPAFTRSHHRSFCLKSEMGRGTPDNPGLMAALDTGGDCHGLVFRIEHAIVDKETRILWSREMISLAYDPTFIAVETPQGEVEALAFVINHGAKNYVGRLALEEQASLISQAEGLFGPNLDYLDNLADHFRKMDIPDEDFFSLYNRACTLAGRADGA